MAIEQATEKVQGVQAFSEKNLGSISRSVYRKVGYREEAEDLTTSILLKALRGVKTHLGVLNSQAWLFQVACTTFADEWRHNLNLLARCAARFWLGVRKRDGAAG